MREIKRTNKEWRDLAYNAHGILKDYWTYEQITYFPLKNLLDEIDFFTPKLREIAKRQEHERLKAELDGKKLNYTKSGGIRR